MLSKMKELFKNFKFAKIEMKPGNEMIRTSWFGRHDYVPYIRLDLWSVGFRISYDPDYYDIYMSEIHPKLTPVQRENVFAYMRDIPGSIGWRAAIKFAKGNGWYK